MNIYGYKAFNINLFNRYGQSFEVGKTYNINGEIKFGNHGNGFHTGLNIEDTLRYFDFFNENCVICLVKGFGKVVEYEDELNDYYDMYAVSKIKILKVMSRKDIINELLKASNEKRVCRFISGYKLNSIEINMIVNKCHNSLNILNSIDYYQLGNKEEFDKTL